MILPANMRNNRKAPIRIQGEKSNNNLFLVYVALFRLSLFAFILSMMAFDLETLPFRFADRLPRGCIAGLLFPGGWVPAPRLAGADRASTLYLNPNIDLASRRPETIVASVVWLVEGGFTVQSAWNNLTGTPYTDDTEWIGSSD
jgi:hypothetical protein